MCESLVQCNNKNADHGENQPHYQTKIFRLGTCKSSPKLMSKSEHGHERISGGGHGSPAFEREHDGNRGVQTAGLKVRAGMLLEVVLPPEPFPALPARVRPQAAVDPLVPRQLLVAGESFPAVFLVAPERPFTYQQEKTNLELCMERAK